MNQNNYIVSICLFLLFIFLSPAIVANASGSSEDIGFVPKATTYQVDSLLNPECSETKRSTSQIPTWQPVTLIEILLDNTKPEIFGELGFILVKKEQQNPGYIENIFNLAQQEISKMVQIPNKRHYVTHRLQYCLGIGYSQIALELNDVGVRLKALSAAWDNLFQLMFTPDAWSVGFGDLIVDLYFPYAYGKFIPVTNNLENADLLAKCWYDLQNYGMQSNPKLASLLLSHIKKPPQL